MRDCGCNAGGQPRLDPDVAGPLRTGPRLAPRPRRPRPSIPVWSALSKSLGSARDDYIEVVLGRGDGRSRDCIEAFLARHARRTAHVRGQDRRVLKLLEIERHAHAHLHERAWFFDELSDIETVQGLQYAAGPSSSCATSPSGTWSPTSWPFCPRPRRPPAAQRLGRLCQMVVSCAWPPAVPWPRSSPTSLPTTIDIGLYGAVSEVPAERGGEEHARSVRLRSQVTWEEQKYAVLHLSNRTAGVRDHGGDAAYRAMDRAIGQAFTKSDMALIIRLIDQHFGARSYTLWHLFTEQKRKILSRRASCGTWRPTPPPSFDYAVMKAMREWPSPCRRRCGPRPSSSSTPTSAA